MSRSAGNLTVVLAVGLVAGLLGLSKRPAPARSAFGFVPGELVHDFRYRTPEGKRSRLSATLRDHEAVVIRLEAQGCGVPQSTIPGPKVGLYTVLPESDVLGALQPASGSEAFLIDRAGTLRYRGNAGDGLTAALDDVMAGRVVKVTRTEAEACAIAAGTSAPERAVTYHNRVSRIVQQNCAVCHRPGGVGPFSLESYDLIYAMRDRVKLMVTERRMPPWFADPRYGDWKTTAGCPTATAPTCWPGSTPVPRVATRPTHR